MRLNGKFEQPEGKAEKEKEIEKYENDEFTLVLNTPIATALRSELSLKKKIIVRNAFYDYPNFFLASQDRRGIIFKMLKEVRVVGEGRYFSSDDGQMVFHKSKEGVVTLVFAVDKHEEVVIPEGVHLIGDRAFLLSKVRTVKFPKSLKVIGYMSFYGCSRLESIELPAVESIGALAFRMCRNLREVKLHEGISVINGKAFEGCEKLEEISIPSSVVELGPSSLGSVSTIRFFGNKFPSGIFSAVCGRSESASLKVYIGKNLLIFPKFGKPSMYYVAEDFLKTVDPEKGDIIALYSFANTPKGRQEIALEGYMLKPDTKAKAYLRGHFLDILNRAEGEKDFLSVFGKFRDLGLLTKSLAEKSLPVAQEKDWSQAAAYVLKYLNGRTENNIKNHKREAFRL